MPDTDNVRRGVDMQPTQPKGNKPAPPPAIPQQRSPPLEQVQRNMRITREIMIDLLSESPQSLPPTKVFKNPAVGALRPPTMGGAETRDVLDTVLRSVPGSRLPVIQGNKPSFRLFMTPEEQRAIQGGGPV